MSKAYREAKTFKHKRFGKLTVWRDGNRLFVNAIDCGRKMRVVRVRKWLIDSRTVPRYALVGGNLPRGTMVDIRDMFGFIIFCRDVLHKDKRAERLYEWLYNDIYWTMMEE